MTNTLSIVISGDNIKYVEGLKVDDYAVVVPNSLYTNGENIVGTVLDCYQQYRGFKVPSAQFEQLEFTEVVSKKAA